MRVFVTGATGVVGRRAIPLLVAAGHTVTAAVREEGKADRVRLQGAAPRVVDLFDANAVKAAIRGHDAIINLATAVPSSPMKGLLPGAWRAMDRVRRDVSRNLVTAALTDGAVERFVQESFAPIYEDAIDRWIDESSRVRPASYNRSALDAEKQAARFAGAGKVGVVLRFGLFYGPADAATLQIADSVRKGRLAMFGAPAAYFSFVHHDDAATAVAASLTVPSGIYNVVDDTPLTRAEIAAGIARGLGVATPKLMPGWAAHFVGSVGDMLSRSLRISNGKLRQATDWKPMHADLLTGLWASGLLKSP